MKITVYQKPTCTTCRPVMAILREMGADIDAINYYVDPIPKSTLKLLLTKMGLRPKDILRSKDQVYKDLQIGSKQYTDAELIDLLVQHPDLLQRPIVERGDKAILARPAERIKELFA